MEDILRSKNDVRPRIGALTQHISQCFILCGVSRVSLLVTVNSDKGRNSTAAGPVYLAMPREVTFHDDDFSSNKYNRKISGYICNWTWNDLRNKQKSSRNYQTSNARITSVPVQSVVVFIDPKISNQFLIILKTNIFILNRKKCPTVHFISFNHCWCEFCEKTAPRAIAWKNLVQTLIQILERWCFASFFYSNRRT